MLGFLGKDRPKKWRSNGRRCPDSACHLIRPDHTNECTIANRAREQAQDRWRADKAKQVTIAAAKPKKPLRKKDLRGL